MEEPSILDYVKSKLFPKKYSLIVIPENKSDYSNNGDKLSNDQPDLIFIYSLPWRLILSLLLALIAQRQLDSDVERSIIPILLYIISAGLVVWSLIINEIRIPESKSLNSSMDEDWTKIKIFYISIPIIIITFFAFSGNNFSFINLSLWAVCIFLLLKAFWQKRKPEDHWKRNKKKVFDIFPFVIQTTKWDLLVFIVFSIAVFYRFYNLYQIPVEMFSDHAEKLLDVKDVLEGKYSIFFPRNTGREAFQMYLTALVSILFNTKISFLSLKIGTALAGVFTLPYIYFLGKEVGNKYVGLIALLFSGIAYWPNVISRVGLRFTLYPLFVAPTLYYFIRGMRKSSRNDFILAGIFLGLGLHGYSPFRFVPILLIIGFIIYLLHTKTNELKKQSTINFLVLILFSFIIFLPLFRYWTQNPEMFGYRAFTRLGTTERAYPGPVILIFMENVWNAMIMPFWKNGNIWVHSVTNRPALDVVSAVFYFFGLLILIYKYFSKRQWEDLFILLSIPILMMPSILSLAFPDENPSLNRTAGALVPIFVVMALACEMIIRGLINRSVNSFTKFLSVLLLIILGSWFMIQNFDLVFNQYNKQFVNNAWNTSEIGKVIEGFSTSIGDRDSAYVVPYPHWVDTRLVGINAGFPEKDYALWPEDFYKSLIVQEPKLFILKSEDLEGLQGLYDLYPDGVLQEYDSAVEGKDFNIFMVY